MEIRWIATYKDILPKGKPKPIEEYFKNVSKAFAFKVGKLLIHNNHKYTSNPNLFFSDWFSKTNARHVENFKMKLSSSMNIVNTISSLNFYECVLKYCGEVDKEEDATMELNLFKAYLVLNTNFSAKSDRFVRNGENEEDELMHIFSFLDQFRSYEYANYITPYLLGATLIKAIEFYIFLERHQQYLDILYKELNVNGWREFLLPLASQGMQISTNRNVTGFDISQGENPENLKDLLSTLILTESNIPDEDFTYLKSNPIYNEGDGKYLVLFNKFFIENIFISTYFRILKNLSNNERTKFRQLFTHDFSEKILFNNAVQRCFSQKQFNCLSGEEFKSLSNDDGEPDACVNNSKCIWLFESKDVFVEKKIKQTDKPQELMETLMKKFLMDGNQKKGITQLWSNIERILNGNWPTNLLPSNLEKIYPIIIVHRTEFNCPGFNRLLDFWHRDKIKELTGKGIDVSKVKPLVVIDIDTLILLSEAKSVTLTDLLDGYIDEVMHLPIASPNKEDNRIEAFLSFYQYIIEKIENLNLFPVERLKQYLPNLFPKSVVN